jgi:response regulator NasT
MQSVVTAFSNPLMARTVSSVLTNGGYEVESVCKSGEDLLQFSETCASRVVVSGFSFPDMDLESLYRRLNGRLAMVIVPFSHQMNMIKIRELTVIPYPPPEQELLLAVERVDKFVSARGQTLPHVRTAEEILLIHRAKEIIIDSLGATEDQAHRFLQRFSMNYGLRLSEAAKMVIHNPNVVHTVRPK